MATHLSAVIVLVLAAEIGVRSFPQGGPAESCDSLLPRHVYTTPRSAEESPYTFVASANTYSQQSIHGIQVEISGATFKGFFVAAIDPVTHKRIGSFAPVKGTNTLPCAAATHADGQLKSRVSLLWQPPADIPQGNVIFMGTVVRSFKVYYTGVVAAVPTGVIATAPIKALV